MLTPDGMAFIADAAATALAGATIEVSDGNVAERVPATITADGAGVNVSATFAENAAVFEWRRRDVVAPDGTTIDREEGDFGRKPAGAPWSVSVDLRVGPERT